VPAPAGRPAPGAAGPARSPGVIGTRAQVRGQHDLGLRPAGHVRAAHPVALVVNATPRFLRPQTSTSVASRSMVTGPPASAAARSAGSSASIRPVTAASPVSTASHCAAVNGRASPAAVVDDSPGTGVSEHEPAVAALADAMAAQGLHPFRMPAAVDYGPAAPVSEAGPATAFPARAGPRTTPRLGASGPPCKARRYGSSPAPSSSGWKRRQTAVASPRRSPCAMDRPCASGPAGSSFQAALSTPQCCC
jgi:hypothetical protein